MLKDIINLLCIAAKICEFGMTEQWKDGEGFHSLLSSYWPCGEVWALRQIPPPMIWVTCSPLIGYREVILTSYWPCGEVWALRQIPRLLIWVTCSPLIGYREVILTSYWPCGEVWALRQIPRLLIWVTYICACSTLIGYTEVILTSYWPCGEVWVLMRQIPPLMIWVTYYPSIGYRESHITYKLLTLWWSLSVETNPSADDLGWLHSTSRRLNTPLLWK